MASGRGIDIVRTVKDIDNGVIQNQNTFSDITVKDNTNRVLVNPVTFNTITLGTNSVLKLI
jgi:hypothetical protein